MITGKSVESGLENMQVPIDSISDPLSTLYSRPELKQLEDYLMKWLNEHEADYDECELLWYLLHQALHANNQRMMGAELRRLYDGNQTRCNMYDQENMILTQNLGK